jgi:hypothetical protein
MVVPIFGFFGSGQFQSDPIAISKTDSIYAIFSSKEKRDLTANASAVKADESTSLNIESSIPCDEISGTERLQYDDCEGDFSGVIVIKRDPEAAPPVRVASMDYLVNM